MRTGRRALRTGLRQGAKQLARHGAKHLHHLGKHAGKVLQHGSRALGTAANVVAPAIKFGQGVMQPAGSLSERITNGIVNGGKDLTMLLLPGQVDGQVERPGAIGAGVGAVAGGVGAAPG